LEGAATFIRLPRLATALHEVLPGTQLHVHIEGVCYIDSACLDLLMNWERQQTNEGGRLFINWGMLAVRAEERTRKGKPDRCIKAKAA
jgi:ABC-type transporter Mla MlaB component